MASVMRLRVLFSICGIVVEAGAFVRLVHQLDGMTNSQLHSCETRAGADVHLAAGVTGGKYSCIRLFDVR